MLAVPNKLELYKTGTKNTTVRGSGAKVHN